MPGDRGLRHQFSNRYYQTKTECLGLKHRVIYPVSKTSLGTGSRLERSIGTLDAALLTQAGGPLGTGWKVQPVPKVSPIFNPILFILLFSIYYFRIAMRIGALHYYIFICHVQVRIMYENN